MINKERNRCFCFYKNIIQKIMTLHITEKKYLEIFASIYNSSNTLFNESERGMATSDTFIKQLQEDENFVELDDDGEAVAFISYHCYGEYYELTSLYIKRECQKMGLGSKLLKYFEKQVHNGSIVFIKVLNNAPWAQRFYRKNGYILLDNETREIAKTLDIFEKKWSTVLCKRIPSL